MRVSEGVTYEIIFIDDGSQDATQSILEDTVRRFPGKFRYIRNPPSGGGSVPRNTGIRAARGEVILMIDDDVEPHDDLVLQHAAFHARYPEPHYAALGVVYTPDQLRSDPMSRFYAFDYESIQELERLNYMYFWTGNVSVKREFMLAAGMFDEDFLYYEDVLCGHRMEQNGMHLRFLPEARGKHFHQMTPSGVPGKGFLLGRWQCAFLERVGWDREALIRVDVLCPGLPPLLLLKRAAARTAFWFLDNPLTIRVLESLGAPRSERSWLTDLYYGIIHYRNMLAGYKEAKKKEAKKK
jgi:glycosyltransferase involved in cell wall biosynthesis